MRNEQATLQAMDDQTLLHHLEQLAQRMGIEVCYEPAGGKAGICMLRGRKRAVIDSTLTVADRAEALSIVLGDCDTEEHYLPPAVRERLNRHAGGA